MKTKKTDFFITYHHSDDDEMAASWIASVLKQARFSTLSDSWDFLPGEAPIKKIEYMFTAAQNVMVLISDRFLNSHGDVKLIKSFCRGPGGDFLEKSPLVAEGKVIIIRIEVCDIETVLGPMEFLDLAGIDAKEAEKRLLEAVGAAEQKEIEPLPGSAGSREEFLAQRKREFDKLLDSTIKHNYHMKLDLEQEVEKEVEVENEKTGKKEKRKQLVWVPIPLDTVLKDGKNYILVNPSGLGKTTFLTYVACALLDLEANYPFLPLFFTCIGLNNRAGSIEDFIRRQVESVYTCSQGSLVSGEWENLCLLLDALDQARDVDDIVSSLLLHDKPLHYKKAKIILSSRQNTADKVKEGFAKIRLKLPEAEEVRHYLGEGNYKKLAWIIEASGELVKAPVLLEMLKTITEKGHVVSTLFNRAELYTEFTKVLLDQERSKPRFWQDKLSIRHFIDFELEQVLEKIAFFSLADNEILEIPKEKLAQYCESSAKKEALLNIGILLELFEDREQKIVFRHQSFQAYFAARYMYYRQPKLFKQLVRDIAFFYNDVWYEVMRFFVGLEKDPQKAENIIDSIFIKDYGTNVLKKSIFWFKIRFKIYDITRALLLIFAVFLMTEARVTNQKVQNLYEQLRILLTKDRQYLDFFLSNIDKFNTSNDERRSSLFIFFTLILRNEDRSVRDMAIEVIEKISTFKDISFLTPLLRDENKDIRQSAVFALWRIDISKDIPLIKPILSHEDDLVPLPPTIIKVLCKIIRENDIPLLKSLLKDEDYAIRYAAVRMLGKIGTSEHVIYLESLLNDKSFSVCLEITHTIKKIGTALNIPLLIPLLRDERKDILQAATKALGRIVTNKDIPLLEPLLMDDDENVRRNAIEVLEKIGGVQNIPIMKPLLKDKNFRVRLTAAQALGKLVTTRDIPLLEPLLRDMNDCVLSASVRDRVRAVVL
jgi:HEAT repeat protein